MKAYTIIFEWSTADCNDIEVEVFSTYEKAVERFNRIIEDESDNSISWVGDAFDEDGELKENYTLECNEQFTDGEEHELWWSIEKQNDWYYHDNLELRILEVK